jgi:hypothetical protein
MGRQTKYFLGSTGLYSSEKFESEGFQDIFISKFNEDKFQDEHKNKYKRRLPTHSVAYLIKMYRQGEEPLEWWDDKEQTFESWTEISEADFKAKLAEWK